MTGDGVVVVGASLSGARTALELRSLGYDGAITVVGAERHLPYERPALSKGYLLGDMDFERLLVSPQSAYDEQGITLRLGTRATALDVERRLVHLDSGEPLHYGSVVLATGSANLRPPIPGIGLPGVHQLRTRDDADALRAAATATHKAVVIGAGFLGCELAATLRGTGIEITMVDALPGPMWAALGPDVSAVVASWHEEQGVRLQMSSGVSAIEGKDKVRNVRLRDESVLAADLVVVAVGARPDVSWLESSALHLAAGGVGVDPAGRASCPDVWAVGDVAAVWDGREHRRTEHYGSAVAQAVRVAHALAGADVPAAVPTAFWSKQYDHFLQYAGRHDSTDDVAVCDTPYAAYFLRSGVLRAVATVDNGRELRRAMKLLDAPVALSECNSPTALTPTA